MNLVPFLMNFWAKFFFPKMIQKLSIWCEIGGVTSFQPASPARWLINIFWNERHHIQLTKKYVETRLQFIDETGFLIPILLKTFFRILDTGLSFLHVQLIHACSDLPLLWRWLKAFSQCTVGNFDNF